MTDNPAGLNPVQRKQLEKMSSDDLLSLIKLALENQLTALNAQGWLAANQGLYNLIELTNEADRRDAFRAARKAAEG